MKKSITKKYSLFFLLLIGALACDTEYFNPIPYATVLLNINTNTTDITLNGQGNYKIFTTRRTENERTGFGGILVYHGVDAFYAYDLACPNEANKDIKVDVIESVLAICPKCGSKYDIASGLGNPVSGPSKYPLKTYSSSSNDGINITIHN